jgi:hypothetical protein
MPFNGSGTFTRVYDWTTDRDNNVKIRADRFDTEDDGYATGLSNTICRNGQSTITANIPMNSFKFTGLAAGSANGHSIRYEQVREKLAADRTYYVRKDGSDSNTGLTDNAAGAFLTIQAAINYVRDRIDASGHAVTIQVRVGTYTEDVVLYPIAGALAGGVGIVLTGDTVTPSNVVISGTTQAIYAYGNIVDWGVSGFKITSAGIGVIAHADARIRFGVMEFGTCTLQQVMATQNGIAELQGTWTSTGNSPSILYADGEGKVLVIANGTTTGTRTYSGATARVIGGIIEFASSGDPDRWQRLSHCDALPHRAISPLSSYALRVPHRRKPVRPRITASVTAMAGARQPPASG